MSRRKVINASRVVRGGDELSPTGQAQVIADQRRHSQDVREARENVNKTKKLLKEIFPRKNITNMTYHSLEHLLIYIIDYESIKNIYDYIYKHKYFDSDEIEDIVDNYITTINFLDQLDELDELEGIVDDYNTNEIISDQLDKLDEYPLISPEKKLDVSEPEQNLEPNDPPSKKGGSNKKKRRSSKRRKQSKRKSSNRKKQSKRKSSKRKSRRRKSRRPKRN
jgi:hypothetical protein